MEERKKIVGLISALIGMCGGVFLFSGTILLCVDAPKIGVTYLIIGGCLVVVGGVVLYLNKIK